MTRINSNINPLKLSDEHLIAEYREIVRVKKLSLKNKQPKIPMKFTLGTGHVTFFYNKEKFLYDRYEMILAEMDNRGFNHNIPNPFDPNSTQTWVPDQESDRLIIDRIIERATTQKKTIKYYGKTITVKDYYRILNTVGERYKIIKYPLITNIDNNVIKNADGTIMVIDKEFDGYRINIFDAKGNKIYYENPVIGYWSRYEYDLDNNMIYYEASSNNWGRMEYDSNSNETFRTWFTGGWRRIEYDSNGKLIKKVEKRGERIIVNEYK
jgi:deoxyribonuclease (pyrimidine dimer)